MAQGDQVALVPLEPREAAVPATGHVLEEHALDRVLRAVRENLLRRRLHQAGTHVDCTLSARP